MPVPTNAQIEAAVRALYETEPRFAEALKKGGSTWEQLVAQRTGDDLVEWLRKRARTILEAAASAR